MALVAAFAQAGVHGHLAEQWDLRPGDPGQRRGDRLAAAGTEDVGVLPAVRADQIRHVLDDAGDALMGLRGQGAGPLGDLGRRDLRRGHHEQLGAGQKLGHRDGYVPGAGRQVEQQDVEVTPVHVGQELLERPVQHGAAPDHRRVALGEHPDGDDLHAVRRRRHDHLFYLRRCPGDPEHPGHRMPVDVGVRDPDLRPGGGQGHGQVDRHRRLADAALAAGHREDPGQRGGLGERDLRDRLAAAQLGLQRPALLVAHHVEFHPHPRHPLDGADRGGHLARDRVPQRAARDREPDIHPDGAVRCDVYVLDHAEFRDGPVDLRIVHAGERAGDLFGGGGGHGGGRHALML